MREIAAGLLACLVLAGCGSATEREATQPEPTASAAPASATTGAPSPPARPPEDPDADFGTVLTANPSIVAPNPIPFRSWTRTGDQGDGVAMHFAIGSPDCYGVDATVTETPTTVTIELRSGTLPESVGRLCTMIAVFATLEVQLQAPVGDRPVLSAA